MRQLMKPLSIRDELRRHSRYIRDNLVPHLSREQNLSHSDTVLVHSIFKKLKSTPMTLDLLRYSRMEKALMVIIATGASCWPMEIVVMAEEMMQKWEDQIGPLKDLRADLYGPDGKLEGLRKITTWEYGRDERDDVWTNTTAISIMLNCLGCQVCLVCYWRCRPDSGSRTRSPRIRSWPVGAQFSSSPKIG